MTNVVEDNALRTEHCDSLPRRLQQLFPRSESPAPDRHDPFDFPGFVVFRLRQPVAVAGYSREADGTVSFMPPTLLVPFDPQLMSAITNVLVPVVLCAVESIRPVCLRCLLDPHQERDVRESLERHGFRNVAEVETWQLRMKTSDAAVFEGECHVTIEHHPTSITRLDPDVVRMLQRAIQDSADLTVLPRPQATPLVTSWMQQHSTVMTARLNSEPAGLVAYRTETSPDAPSTVVTLEYIGVDPAHRRSGVARCLLRSAVQKVARDNNPSGTWIVVNARVDRSNDAAVKFYRHCGFQRVGVHDLLTLSPAAWESVARPDAANE